MTDTATKDPEVNPLVGGQDPTQIYVAGMGYVYSAPQDTPLPTLPLVVPAVAPWVDRGLTTEDGVEFTFGKTVDALKAWQVFDPVRLITTEAPKTVKFTLMQANAGNIILAMGGGSVGAQGLYTPPNPASLTLTALLIVAQDGGSNWSFYCPRAMVNANVVIPWKKSGEAQIPLEFGVQAAAPGAQAYNFIFPTVFGTQLASDAQPEVIGPPVEGNHGPRGKAA
jgi:hypothetical protein